MQDYLTKPIDTAALTRVLQGLEERTHSVNLQDSSAIATSPTTTTTPSNKAPGLKPQG
ncbi:MAG: hypothetical protein AAGC93_29985 [Cyanobacteria bacterium P01_F01_bin.53]